MTDADRRISAEISPFPPFLKITTTDVGAIFRRRRRSITQTGPFLIISVDSGLAMDTAFRTEDGSHPHLWTAHGQAHQLWRLIPSGHEGEARIVSLSNNLSSTAAAATRGTTRRCVLRPMGHDSGGASSRPRPSRALS